jgi:hypothetical protein
MQPNNRHSNWKVGFLFIAFVITLRSAYLLHNDDYPLFSLTLVIFVLGCILFVLGTPRPISWPNLPAKEEIFKWQNQMVGLSVIFSIISFIIFWRGNNSPKQFTGLPMFLWVISLLIFLGGGIFAKASTEEKKSTRVEILFLILVVFGSFLLRTYHINVFPNGCQTDECHNGLDALKWLQGQPYTPYAETNEGQATLFTYLLALSFKLFGVGVTQMRMVSAVIGTVTIVAFYFLARDWLEWRFALTATILFAVARWHLTFSRIVYELILTPLAEILVFLFFLRALKNGRRKDWALSGLCLAFGMNTYTGFRIVPILIAIYLIYWIITHHDRIQRDAQGILYLGLGAWIGMVPLSVYILQNWNIFMGRTTHISILTDITNAGGSWQPLWENIYRAILSFHWKGDLAALNNLPGAPLLDIVVGILFLFGLAYALRYISQPLSFLYISWVIAGLSLSILSAVNESPTARRPIGLLPVIFLMSGTVLQLTWDTLRSTFYPFLSSRFKNAYSLIIFGEVLFLGLVTLSVGVININTYFNIQSKNNSVWHAYSAIEAAIGEYLRDLPAEDQVYLDSGVSYHSAVIFISQSRPYTILNLAEHLPILDVPNPPKDIVYILTILNDQLEPMMKQIYPQGIWEVHQDPFGGTLFYTFKVSAKTLEQANNIKGEYYFGNEISDNPVVTRQDTAINFQRDLSDKLPLPAPFSAKWSGSIYFPDGYREYGFAINTDGAAELLIDGKSVLKTSANGLQVTSVSSPFIGGFHTFVLNYHSGINPKELTLLWKSSDSDFVSIPRSVFFNAALARNGLTGYYYPNENMTGPPSLIQHDLVVLPNDVLPVPFSIVWKGKIEIPKSGEYIFGAYADDGSYVYIDHRLVVDNGGSHGGMDVQGTVTLDQGFHDLEIRYWELGGSRKMKFWWRPPGKIKENVPLAYLFLEEGQYLNSLDVIP